MSVVLWVRVGRSLTVYLAPSAGGPVAPRASLLRPAQTADICQHLAPTCVHIGGECLRWCTRLLRRMLEYHMGIMLGSLRRTMPNARQPLSQAWAIAAKWWWYGVAALLGWNAGDIADEGRPLWAAAEEFDPPEEQDYESAGDILAHGSKASVLMAPWSRRELEAEDAKTAIPAKGKQQKKRKPSKKSDLFSWVQGGVMNAVSFLWLRRSAGGSLAMCFLGWRAWRVLGLGSVLQTVYESVLAAGEVAEGAHEWYEKAEEMYESGELEQVGMALGVGIAALYLGYLVISSGAGLGRLWKVCESDSESEASDSEVMVGTTVADSDDEPDSRHLFAELARGQNTLQASVAALADLLGQRGKGEGHLYFREGAYEQPSPLEQLIAFEVAKLFHREGLIFTAVMTAEAEVEVLWEDLTRLEDVFTFRTATETGCLTMVTNDGRFGALQCEQDRKAVQVEATEFRYDSKWRTTYCEQVLKIEPRWDMTLRYCEYDGAYHVDMVSGHRADELVEYEDVDYEELYWTLETLAANRGVGPRPSWSWLLVILGGLHGAGAALTLIILDLCHAGCVHEACAVAVQLDGWLREQVLMELTKCVLLTLAEDLADDELVFPITPDKYRRDNVQLPEKCSCMFTLVTLLSLRCLRKLSAFWGVIITNFVLV
ncbi:unnamed protein product [Prorocentrum cordatum]|uniref:Uncharacterized protein n=1 Tax=Prorocentrum cordatum TaxID=2364126 RepID=A0ABN9VFT3_9DINO|nr:unnamed protein product [Polarella glacialis]